MDTTNTYTEPLVFSLNACSLPFMHYKEASTIACLIAVLEKYMNYIHK
jgi:hypothetical protein